MNAPPPTIAPAPLVVTYYTSLGGAVVRDFGRGSIEYAAARRVFASWPGYRGARDTLRP